MKEQANPKLSYYQLNKDKWRKGGKYYTYKPVSETRPKIPMEIKRGKFIISFD